MELADLFGELRHDLEQVAHDAVVRDLEDRRVLVLVDRDDHFRRPHARQMLDRSGNADGDVERRAHRLAGLPHLIGVGTPSGIDHRARRAHRRTAAKGARELFQYFEIRRLFEATPARNDHLRFSDIERAGRRRLDLAHGHSARTNVDRDRLARGGFRPLHRCEHVGTQREHGGLRRYFYLEQCLARIHRPCDHHTAAISGEISEIRGHTDPELGRDAWREIFSRCGCRKHERAIPALLRALREGLRVAFGGVSRERGIGECNDLVRAELGDLLEALDGPGTADDCLDWLPPPAPQALGTGHDLERNLPQRAVTLLQHRQRRHRTLASSRSSRTSSPTAPAPSPTIFPSLRSGGGDSATTSNVPADAWTGFTSSGFFFAAMMPLSAGYRGSLSPLSAVRTAGRGNSTTSIPPSISRSATPFVPSMSRCDTAVTHGRPSSSATSGPTWWL